MATTAPYTPYHVKEASMPDMIAIEPGNDCLKERKWWCFLLSSIFTFLMGVLSVLLVRGFIYLFCKKNRDEYSQVTIDPRGR